MRGRLVLRMIKRGTVLAGRFLDVDVARDANEGLAEAVQGQVDAAGGELQLCERAVRQTDGVGKSQPGCPVFRSSKAEAHSLQADRA